MEMLQNGLGIGIISLIALAVLVVLFFIIFSARYKKARPDVALIINGSFLGNKNVTTDATGNKLKIIRSGGTFVIPIFQESSELSLLSSKLDVSTPEVYTEQGVPVLADGTAIIKIGSSSEHIATAAEQFLGKSRADLENEAREVLEGHLRSILGSMTVEEIYQNRDKFSQSVQEVASVDLEKMGLVIVSFTIKEVKDTNGYLDSLGKPRIAQVKRDAEIAEAEAIKETRIKKAQAEQESQQAELQRQTEIAEASKEKELKLADYRREQDIAKAKADQAYGLENAKLQQEVKEQEMEVQIIERQKQIELEEKEITRREKQYDSEVKKKADADRYAREQEALAQKAREIAEAEAEAEKVKLSAEADATAKKQLASAEADAKKQLADAEAFKVSSEGKAKAESIEAVGKAEAEAKEKLAEALAKYGEAAIIEMIISVMPQMAEQIAKPISNIDKVTVLDGGSGSGVSNFAGNTGKMIASTQEVISETLGLDVADLIQSFVSNKNIGAKVAELTETIKEENTKDVTPTKEVESTDI